MRNRSLWFSFSLVLALSMLLALPFSAAAGTKPPSVNVQILALNDFHGALDTTLVKPKDSTEAQWYYRGGAEYLANFVNAAVADNPNTLKVSAGDMIGASPLLSAAFHDEPTIQAFNLMGFDFAAVGNHEFDEGWQELLRLQNGGCNPVDGCFTGVPEFTGATFRYLTANVVRLDRDKLLFKAYGTKAVGGAKIGYIGVSLESTPTIVVPSSVAGLEFTAEVAAINEYAAYLKNDLGIKAIVVLLHDGGGFVSPTDPNKCNLADPFFSNVVMNLDPEIDVVITGHTHNAYNCLVPVNASYDPMIVTSAGANGQYLTDIDLTIAGNRGQVIARSATNIPVVTPYLTAVPNAAMKTLLDQYRVAIAPIANKVIGSITADIKGGGNMVESALGDVIADAQLEFTKPAGNGGSVVALTNPGGIRKDLLFDQISGGELPGQVTYAEAFAVQPFSNLMVAMDLTGAQLKAVLEQQATAGSDGSGRLLQISASLTYTWTASAAAENKVSNLKINGVAVDPATTYRVTVNNFLAGGGDKFTRFTVGTNLYTSGVDLDAFVAYITAHSPVAPGPMNRVKILP